MYKQIEIHPGHWNLDYSGAVGLIKEVTEARKVVNEVVRILKQNKVDVVKYEDNVSKNPRDNVNHLIKKHNEDNDALVVSVHFNSSGATVVGPIGTETLYTTQKSLATEISAEIAKASGLKDRGPKYRDNIGVLTRTVEKTILIEVCFVNSKEDVRIYKEKFDEICFAIAKVLAKQVGKTISKEPVQEKTVEKGEIKLTNNARNACISMIKRAVKEGIFKDPHKDVEKYDDNKLLNYSLIYINSKLSK